MKAFHQQAISEEIQWLDTLIKHRVQELNQEEGQTAASIADIAYPPSHHFECHYQQLLQKYEFDIPERLLLALAIARGVFPQVFKPLVKVYKNIDKQYEFGGILEPDSNRFIPTLRTLFFLLSGRNLQEQFYHHLTFTPQHVLFEYSIVNLENDPRKEQVVHDDLLYQRIKISDAYLKYFLGGEMPTLDSEEGFPATLLETDKTFDDLVLPDQVIKQLDGPMNYIKGYRELLKKSDTKGKIKPGYLILLHGKPGTGKTLTSSVMGNYLGVEVYYLSLSRVVSKYIGETEKNLEKVFNRLEKKLCILFVDEADALFGKRTEVQDSKDRYANQEVAYLLQRVERFPGVVILATNYEQNLDDAFTRRILSHIHIPLPNQEARTQLWQRSIPQSFRYEYKALAQQLGEAFALTGGNISNIIKQACLKATQENTQTLLYKEHLEEFIEYEFKKEKRDFKETNFRKIPDKVGYLKPSPADEAPLSETQEAQVKLWLQYLPSGWSFVPDRLPQYLAQQIQLTEEEIHQTLQLVWSRHHQDVVKAFDFSKLAPGFKAIFKKHYASEKLAEDAWNNIKQMIEQAIGHTPAVAPDSLKTDTSQTTPSNQGNDAWISGPEAEKLWNKHLPKGFEFVPASLPKNISRFYKVRESHIKKILVKACTLASKEGTQQIQYTAHIAQHLEEVYKEENMEFK
ncbi:MAG TPA: hypothetical protein DCS93_11790 [Microscillaceae bacterium]|nr:hypothetical protein [Microscillaceae bacterium]